ncbi:hypothetical protein Neosp_005462 [[Neocosmospora] mangrovei]
MESTPSRLRKQSWRRGSYLISTNSSLIPVKRLIDIFNSDDFYWADALPEAAMKEMLDNSLCFGLYDCYESPDETSKTGSPDETERKIVGIARGVTDYTTFLYLTDVWVDPSYQGKGLGSWLVRCVQEVIESLPHLRRSLLMTGDWERSVPFYEKLMEMELFTCQKGEGLAVMERKGLGHPNFGARKKNVTMDPKIYAIHKRLNEQARQRFEPTVSRSNSGPKGITIPVIRPPENCENRKRHVIDYRPLPTSTSIRVLQVHPEKFENEFDFYTPPRCSLIVKDLDDDPIYDALSYTWSCPVTIYSDASEVSSAAAWAAPSFDVICDGKPFSVTANLYTAILSLRLRASKTGHRYCRTLAGMEGSNMTEIASPTLYIWIDQICINQSDVKERNSQVMLMGRIYKQSRLCLVWLGGDDQFSQTAIDTMTKLLNTEDEMFSKLAALTIFHPQSYHDIGMELVEPCPDASGALRCLR